MNTYEIQSLRPRMEATLRDLKIAENTTKSKLKESSEVYSSVFCDELDSAKAEVDLKTALEIHAHSIAQQVPLQNAIARMETGKFGVCLNCGDGIGEA